MKSRIVILTGCTRGLGRALLEYLGEHDFQVVGCGRSAKAIAKIKKEFSSHDFDAIDVADDAAVTDGRKGCWPNTGRICS